MFGSLNATGNVDGGVEEEGVVLPSLLVLASRLRLLLRVAGAALPVVLTTSATASTSAPGGKLRGHTNVGYGSTTEEATVLLLLLVDVEVL